ncbi:Sac2 family-domain-containing protein [Dimargaris cristalligena]|uniref:Sac2 family-domain-containing protein n=1 Tax=Dimargaris cristalligena TaxID=215637 RepID=A0A4Q0A2Y3_9FUNG|nr:Sac2 family-domain-containing protein [Dimargaris cristalligena]|eukprot:RKP40437.1 Sac2 family-domain-containing protein [Dimargaris cristalligena]
MTINIADQAELQTSPGPSHEEVVQLAKLLRKKPAVPSSADESSPPLSNTRPATSAIATLSLEDVNKQLGEFQENEAISQLLSQGRDLKEHAQDIERQLREAELEHLENYFQQKHRLTELDEQVQDCDSILSHMETLLSGFQVKLGNINQEIRDLQDQSVSMSVRLKNRQQVEDQLERAIDGLAITPALITSICDHEVNQSYIEPLLELDHKIRVFRHQSSKNRTILALADTGPELERLRLVAAAKVRHFLLNKIKSIRTLATNIQILQRSIFLKYRALNHFVIERHSETASEIRDNYIFTARLYFADHFERYAKALQRLQATAAERGDMLGYDESSKAGGIFGGTRPALKDRRHIFGLGDRIHVLTRPEPQVIIPHVAEDRHEKFTFELLFRSFNLALIDNTTSEYEFLLQFFVSEAARARHSGADIAKAIFDHVFAPVCAAGTTFTQSFVESTYDALGILLCIRINQQLINELQRRRVPVLDGYMNATNMLLWPRFQTIISLHIDSIKKVSSGNRPRLSKIDVHPHFVSRRYAEFVASLLILNQVPETNILDQSVRRLRNELEAMLLRISEGFNDRVTTLIFLINNYDLILTILNENGFEGDSDEEVDYFARCKTTCVSEYVEEQLDTYFGYLKSFVIRAESYTDLGGGHGDGAVGAGGDTSEISVDQFDKVIAEFNANFRGSLANINAAVIRNFSNFKNGTHILHSVLGQLILYYNRFYHLFDRRFTKKTAAGSGAGRPNQWPVGIQNVMVEIKKYKSNF